MRRNVLKGLGIGFFLILLSLVAMYLGLAHYYMNMGEIGRAHV